jgi:polysaccharide export outer membrane protein
MRILIFIVLVFSAAVAFAQNGEIDSISVGVGDGAAYSVYLKGSGNLEYSEVRFDDPPRLALDFPNIKNRFTTKNFEPKDNPYIRLIRMMDYYKGTQKVSRILVELKSNMNHTVSRTPTGLALQFSEVNGSSQATSNGTTTAPITNNNTSAEIPKGDGTTTVPAGSHTVKTTNPPATTVDNSKPIIKDPATSNPPAPVSTDPAVPATTNSSVPTSLDVQIGFEDLLDISVFELPQFSVSSRVSGDGTITMPLIGSIEVRGLTKKQVEDKIALALAKYVNDAKVSVTIKEYKSRQVSVLGAVKNPGAYYIVSPRTLLQLISEAGGLTADAGSRCYIFRQGSSKVEIDLLDLINNGNQTLNVPILPGDVVNIPADTKVIVYVLGAVRTPGAIEMTTSMPITLLAAIARAGGPTEQASQSNIQIKRKDPSGSEKVIKANLKDIIKGKTPDIKLNPGDVVNVPESFF